MIAYLYGTQILHHLKHVFLEFYTDRVDLIVFEL